MPTKIIDDAGETIFEFDNDGFFCAVMLGLIGQAKHGDALRPEITMNAKINALARAIIDYGARRGVAGYRGADGHFPRPPRDPSWPPAWAFPVEQLIFAEAPSLTWWRLSAEEKRARVAEAFYPHKLSDEALTDHVESIDFRIARYRADATE